MQASVLCRQSYCSDMQICWSINVLYMSVQAGDPVCVCLCIRPFVCLCREWCQVYLKAAQLAEGMQAAATPDQPNARSTSPDSEMGVSHGEPCSWCSIGAVHCALPSHLSICMHKCTVSCAHNIANIPKGGDSGIIFMLGHEPNTAYLHALHDTQRQTRCKSWVH